MKIGIIGANGKAGSFILKEAENRGLDVTAIVRDSTKMVVATPILEKDVYHLTAQDIEQFDVVVDALGFWTDLEQHVTATKHLLNIAQNLKTRLLFVGGAGSLFINEEQTLTLKDSADFPADFKPLATAMGKALELIKQAKNVQWTYLSPAADFQADEPRTGHYQTAGEQFTVNAAGKSSISYADYGIAMVDEIIEPKHLNQRFSVYQ